MVNVSFKSSDNQEFILHLSKPFTDKELEIFTSRTGNEIRAMFKSAGFETIDLKVKG